MFLLNITSDVTFTTEYEFTIQNVSIKLYHQNQVLLSQ